VCVCAFSLRRESPDMILGDKPLIFEVVLSQQVHRLNRGLAPEEEEKEAPDERAHVRGSFEKSEATGFLDFQCQNQKWVVSNSKPKK
jgi:hypothetical protein